MNINKNFRKHKNIKFFIHFLILVLLLFLYFILNKKYNYCFQCLKQSNNSRCFECPNEILFKDFTIISKEKTLNDIIKYNKSISRYGDGEFNLIFGNKIYFQNYNKNLSKRLLEILNSNEINLLIGIFIPFKKELNLYNEYEAKFWINWMSKNKLKLLKILNKNKKYYSSDITRFYTKYKKKVNTLKIINKLKKIWEGRDILVVEGEKKDGIGSSLFINSKSIKRIICPTKNAFKIYDKILNAIIKVNKNTLIIISLGPTATVLAYDLTKLGYQAIDIGHSYLQYELYLKNEKKIFNFPNKFVNETRNKDNIGNILGFKYYNQVIEKITN